MEKIENHMTPVYVAYVPGDDGDGYFEIRLKLDDPPPRFGVLAGSYSLYDKAEIYRIYRGYRDQWVVA